MQLEPAPSLTTGIRHCFETRRLLLINNDRCGNIRRRYITLIVLIQQVLLTTQ